MEIMREASKFPQYELQIGRTLLSQIPKQIIVINLQGNIIAPGYAPCVPKYNISHRFRRSDAFSRNKLAYSKDRKALPFRMYA